MEQSALPRELTSSCMQSFHVPKLSNMHVTFPWIQLLLCVEGEGFVSWSQLPHLTSVSLQNGWRVSDEGLEALGRCQAPLRHLNLKGCRLVSNSGLAALVKLSHVTHLSLQVSTV